MRSFSLSCSPCSLHCAQFNQGQGHRSRTGCWAISKCNVILTTTSTTYTHMGEQEDIPQEKKAGRHEHPEETTLTSWQMKSSQQLLRLITTTTGWSLSGWKEHRLVSTPTYLHLCPPPTNDAHQLAEQVWRTPIGTSSHRVPHTGWTFCFVSLCFSAPVRRVNFCLLQCRNMWVDILHTLVFNLVFFFLLLPQDIHPNRLVNSQSGKYR